MSNSITAPVGGIGVDYDRPDVALARAVGLAREVSVMIRGVCADALDERACGVAATVARAADERSIWQDRYVGPLIGLEEALDRLIRASVAPTAVNVVVGSDEDGPIMREVMKDLPDPRLVALRDRVRTLSATLEAVRDIIVADEAITQMRRAAG
jgi:hypothetical protein